MCNGKGLKKEKKVSSNPIGFELTNLVICSGDKQLKTKSLDINMQCLI